LLIPKTKSESTAETAKGYSAVRVPTALVWCSELGLGYCCTTSKHSWGRNGEHQAPRTQYLEASCCSALSQNQLSQRVSINTEHTRGAGVTFSDCDSVPVQNFLIRCQAKFLTSRLVRMHTVVFFLSNTLRNWWLEL